MMLSFVNSYASLSFSCAPPFRLTPPQGKDKKRAEKSVAQSRESFPESSSAQVDTAALQKALEQVKNEDVPESPQEKEAYFMSHVSMGEQLSAQGIRYLLFACSLINSWIGPDFYLAAAMSFYRALRVYPAPVELIVIYQKTVPEPIFKVHSLSPFF
jgi:mitochondrial import receptor subunit TOM20